MTRKQFDRWRDFALRMARTYPSVTEARRARITREVERYFEALDPADWQGIRDWDSGEPMGAGDHLSEHLQYVQGYWTFCDRRADEWEWRLEAQMHCCIRAGIDLACEPSAGVLGFTVGDLRRMFDGRIPLWISRQYRGGLNRAQDGEKVWL